MEDKDKKKNVKKIIVYAVLLVLIMGIALGTGQIQTEELGRIFTVNAVAVCKLLLLIFGVLFLKSLIVWILGLIKPANHRASSVIRRFDQPQVCALSVIQSDKIYCVSGDPVRRTDDPWS